MDLSEAWYVSMPHDLEMSEHMEDTSFNVPEGFVLLDRDSPFSDLTGPYYEKRENGKHVALGMYVTPQHVNKIRLTHGGVYMTLADNAFGDAILSHFADVPVTAVTVSLTCQFLAASRPGDWLEARVVFNKIGRKLIFGDCQIFNGEQQVFSASAIFSVMQK
ncbi:MAG: PaaI family thioesterase [Pelistega sp.]|nr:PaaI family thioesterase [Pelistega sp.]